MHDQAQAYDPNYYRALNPAPPQQSYAPQQQPVNVGQQTNGTQSNGSGWKTAALWVAGVAGATIISYFVTKALVKGEEKIANALANNPDEHARMPRPPDPVAPSAGVTDDFAELRSSMKDALNRLADMEQWVHAHGGNR